MYRKTDHTDACGLLEAARNPRIHPGVPKTVAQQELLALHRIRRQWMDEPDGPHQRGPRLPPGTGIAHRTRGARACVTAAARLADPATPIPAQLRAMLELLLVEIRELETRVRTIDRHLARVATDAVVQRL